MPIDDLTALGQKMREARKEKGLTQQELADLSHVSIKQIAKIEKGKINPSYLILKALAKVLPISLDTLINPDVSPEDEGATQMKMLWSIFDCCCVFSSAIRLLSIKWVAYHFSTSGLPLLLNRSGITGLCPWPVFFFTPHRL